jgi:hypothetical protein
LSVKADRHILLIVSLGARHRLPPLHVLYV